MLASVFRGQEYLLISGTEGLKATRLTDGGESWTWETWLEHEVSEMELCDLNGDGTPELVTIAPFHGDKLTVYRFVEGEWVEMAESPLDYGHGLWSGTILGRPAIIVSNRSGSKDLELLRLGSDESTLERILLDRGVAAANIEVLEEENGVRLFTTNQESGEVAMYYLS
jgi:hypothetical protein